MRRVPRWWLIPVVITLVLSGLAAAYWVGAGTASRAEPQPAASGVVPVWAAVERRAVVQQVTLAGRVVAGAQSAIAASPAEGIDRLVVTSVQKAVGSAVAPGELLAVVSGRPLLMLPSNVPLYRDIAAGDSGPDVTALQKALAGFGYAVNASGIFDNATQGALMAWYKAAGCVAPVAPPSTEASGAAAGKAKPVAAGAVFRWREFAQVPGDTGKIASIAGPGSVLAEDGIVAQVTVSNDTIVARADVVQAESFAVGTAVTVRAGAAVLDTTVATVGGFMEGDESKNVVPGKDITLRLPPGTQGFAADQSVTLTAGSAAVESLAVPLMAVRQEQGRAYVQVEGGREPRRVEVTVTAQADGWAALEEVEGLTVGDRVLLP